MKNAIKYTLAAIFFALLTACGEKAEPKAEPKAPSIPTMSVHQILDMSQNQRQELERRCLGVSHPTCDEFAKGSVKRLMELRISLCKVDAAQKGLYDRYGAERDERKCDEMR